METDRFILALLNSVPDQTVRGRKRLQKLAFLLKDSGARCDASFKLKNFGPYSSQVEQSAYLLTFLGDIEEKEEKVGYAEYLASVFVLTDEGRSRADQLSEHFTSILTCLDKYSTLELEIASTIRYFERSGSDVSTAVRKTQEMKPSKTKQQVIERARHALRCLP